MNITLKISNIKSSPPEELSEKKPETDRGSIENFLLGFDKPIEPEQYELPRVISQDIDQGFLETLSIPLIEPPSPPQANISPADLFTPYIKPVDSKPPVQATMDSATEDITSPVTLGNADVIKLPEGVKLNTVRDTHNANTYIEGISGAPAKDVLVQGTNLHHHSSVDHMANAPKDETLLVSSIKSKNTVPLSLNTPDEVTTAKIERLTLPANKLVEADTTSNETIAKPLPSETAKPFQSSPELSAEDTMTLERARIKGTPQALHFLENTKIVHSLATDTSKLVGDVSPPLGPMTNPISDSAVKVPQSITITAPTSTSHPAVQTVAQTLVKAQETQSGISVRLDPPEMGRVFIDFRFEADRSVTAIIRSEVAETAILLKDKAEFFQQALKDSGFDSVNLSFEQNDQSKQKAFDHDNTEKAPTFFSTEYDDEDAPHNVPPPSHKYKLSTNTAIDIKL